MIMGKATGSNNAPAFRRISAWIYDRLGFNSRPAALVLFGLIALPGPNAKMVVWTAVPASAPSLKRRYLFLLLHEEVGDLVSGLSARDIRVSLIITDA